MRSVMRHQFSQVPSANIPRSSFDRSHGNKTAFDAGLLVPIYLDEALPADTHILRMSAFARLATPVFPIMDNMFMETFFFAVPMRLIWDNWQKFNGEQTNPGDSIDYIIPTMTSPGGPPAGYQLNSLEDYFGLPTQVSNLVHSCLFHRAYYLIWNEWFRDQNLQNSLTVATGDGPDLPTAYTIQRRGKRHDYFTSCLPWPQKGDSIDLPLGTTAPVLGLGAGNQTYSVGPQAVYETGGSGTTNYANYKLASIDTAPNHLYVEEDPLNTGFPGIYADLSNATAATINQLRQAFQIQKLIERDARGGSRYTEIIRAHFGVISPDQRLQRPEFLGGGSTPLNINPIAQTSSTDATSPQGNLAAMGTFALEGHGFSKSFTEHCLIIGLANIRADLTYQQGLDRMFSRSTRYDFYWPALANIGEQAVLNKEIYAQGGVSDDEVFGYQERYAEYRYKPSRVSGLFRSNAAGTLDKWHLSEDFSTLPALNSSFIEDNPPVDRVISVPSQPHVIFDSFFQLRSVRPMPLYGVPGLIDHF